MVEATDISLAYTCTAQSSDADCIVQLPQLHTPTPPRVQSQLSVPCSNARLLVDAGAIAHLRNKSMVGAWAGWQEYCELQQEKRDKLAAAVSMWTHKELASAFANFRLNVLEQKAVRLSLLHWQHMNLSKVFQRWKEYKARRARLFGALIALACKWEQPLMEDTFAAWRDFIAERERIKVVLPMFGFAGCVLAVGMSTAA